MQRSTFKRHKPVILINDYPTQSEVRSGDKFSSISNMSLLTSLRTGKVHNYNKVEKENFEGINSVYIYQTYLSYFPPEEGNFDFKNEFLKRKDLDLEGVRFFPKNKEDMREFFALLNQKDVFVSEKLYKEFLALIEEIKEVNPSLILVTGKWSLFFLTGCVSVASNIGNYKDKKPLGCLATYRASVMKASEFLNLEDKIIFPFYHTIHSMGMVDKIPIIEQDLKRAGSIYKNIQEKGVSFYNTDTKNYILGTTKEIIFNYLDKLLGKLFLGEVYVATDIETIHKSVIDCIGLAYTTYEGLCIPFATKNNPAFWSLEDEIEITIKLTEVLTHKNYKHIGQNYSYDCQYYYKLYNIDINPSEDTLILNHILFNFLPKDLAFLASIYCEKYTYWKSEIEALEDTPETRWIYNIKDNLYTLEVFLAQQKILKQEEENLQDLYRFTVDQLHKEATATMNKGVKINKEKKEELYKFFYSLMENIKGSTEKIGEVEKLLGFYFNIDSTPQKKKVFQDFLNIKIKVRKGTETCDAAAMLEYIEDYPEYSPLLKLLLEFSSLKVFTTNFLGMKLDDDNRARTQYKVAGTGTGRLASTKNVWGNGGNFQNIPEKGKIKLHYAKEVLEDSLEENYLDYAQGKILEDINITGDIELPNVKKIFLPDEGMEIADGDYSGADFAIVMADSGCKWGLDYLSNPKNTMKVYKYISSMFFNREITDEEYKCQKAIYHGCLTGDHEVLTPSGWVRLENYDYTKLPIAVWNKDTFSIHFELPRDFNIDFVDKEEDLLLIEGDSFSQLVTLDHKFPHYGNQQFYVKKAKNLPNSARLPYTGEYVGGSEHLSPYLVQLIVAFQADGTIRYTTDEGKFTYAFRLVKERKIKRLKFLLEQLNISYTENCYDRTTSNEIITIAFSSGLLPEWKYLGWYILNWSKDNLHTFVDELVLWDGHSRKTNGIRDSITTTNKLSCEILQTVIQLTGKGSKVVIKERDYTRQTLYEISINNRKFYRKEKGITRRVQHSGTTVYCPQTSTGFFMVRRKNHVMVTGNTNYGLGIKKLAIMAGIEENLAMEMQKFYFSLNPEVKIWQENIAKAVKYKGYITNIFGRKGWFLNTNDATLLNKALAFKPQSTIADLVNHAWVNIRQNYPEIDVLMQVHDSLVMQYPIKNAEFYRTAIPKAMELALPFKTPLIVPADIKISRISYGDTMKISKFKELYEN